jgi:hypothetical protein
MYSTIKKFYVKYKMIKCKELYNIDINNEINYNEITFNRFIQFIAGKYNLEYEKKKILSYNYDSLCEKILLLETEQKSSIKPNISIKDILSSKDHSRSYSIFGLIKYIVSDITLNTNFLVISDYIEFIQLLNKIVPPYYDKIIYNKLNNQNINLKNKVKTANLFSYKYFDYKHINNIFDIKNKKKYDNIIIKHSEKYCNNFIQHFQYLQIPNMLISITTTLLNLKQDGNLYYFLRIGGFNEAFHKIIKLLFYSFTKVELIKDQILEGSSYLIKCSGFLNNIEPKIINNLINISIESRKHTYTDCQYFNYIYYIQQQYPKKKFFYKINLKNNTLQPSTKSIKFIDDIDYGLNLDSTQELQFFIYNIKKIFSSYLENLNFNILKYSTEDDKGNINITPEYINNINYKNILYAISFFKENNIPYNKSYLTYINKYNKNIINQLYSYKYAIKHKIIKYKSQEKSHSQKKTIKKIKNSKYHQKQKSYKKQKQSQIQTQIKIQKESYHYDNFNKMNDLNTMAYKVKLNLLEQFAVDSVPRNIKIVTEDFARGVSSYLTQNFKLHYKVSNAFCKLWEIFHTIDDLLPITNKNGKPTKIFFVAEAPGQWIYASNLYFQNQSKSKSIQPSLEWRANTLNPQNPANIQKYGKDIFDDQYGFMKKYPNQWIFGADDTGDITNSANQRWYRQYAKEFGPIDLVTGDGGILSDNPLIFQKLDYAQMCMVASLSSKGGNCVIKHFLPYVRRAPISYYGYGLFINYLYLYNLMFDEFNLVKPLTSNPDSGEFYVVCKGFRGVSEEMYEKMLNVLDNFTVNICFFDRKDIPDEFVNQIMDFVDKLLNMNVEHSEITNLLLTCMVHKNPVIEEQTRCSKYLDKKYIEKIHNEKFKEWVKNNEFE